MAKKLLLPVLFVIAAHQVAAQVTISFPGYPTSFIGIDSQRQTQFGSVFPNLTPAASATWDMDTCTYSSIIYNDCLVASTTGAEFADSTQASLAGLPYFTKIQKSVTAGGYVSYGQLIKAGYVDLATVGAGDSLVIDSQYVVYSTPDTILKLPATYLTQWQTNFTYNINFHLTYLPLLVNAPGYIKNIETTVDTVVGWGQMRVMPLYGSLPTGYMNVLQVKCLTYVIDSFYVDGFPAPSTLLARAGVTQGQMDTLWEQNYYRPAYIEPVAYVSFNSGFAMPQSATTDGSNLPPNLGVNTTANDNSISIYPNPLINRMFTIALPPAAGEYRYELIDMTGHIILRNTMNGNGETVTLANNAAAGIYFLKVYQGGNVYCVRGIDVSK